MGGVAPFNYGRNRLALSRQVSTIRRAYRKTQLRSVPGVERLKGLGHNPSCSINGTTIEPQRASIDMGGQEGHTHTIRQTSLIQHRQQTPRKVTLISVSPSDTELD